MQKQRKNTLKIILLLSVLLILITPKEIFASDFTVADGIITEYNGTGQTEIIIPETIIIPDTTDEITIKGIGQYVFCQNSEITKVTIPGTVEYIGEFAFSCLPNLSQVIIQDGVKEIRDFAFFTSPSLTSITIPGSVKKIGNGAFSECENLGVVKVEEGVEEIGEKAFNYAISLTQIDIPESVEVIAVNAFNDASTNFTIKCPQYKTQNNGKLEETVASIFANKISGQINGVQYEPTNFGITKNEINNGEVTISENVVQEGRTLEIIIVQPSAVYRMRSMPYAVNNDDEIIQVTIKPDRGYEVDKITYTVNGGSDIELTETQLTMPAGNVDLNVKLKQRKHKITVTQEGNGTVSPNGIVEVGEYQDQKFRITPDEGYLIDKVIVDGEELTDLPSRYTFYEVVEPHSIEVVFREIEEYTLTTNISNIIETTVTKSENQDVTIKTGTDTSFLSWAVNGIEPQNSRRLTFNMPRNDVEITYTYQEPLYNTTTIDVYPSYIDDMAKVTLDQEALSNQISVTESDTIEISVYPVASDTEVTIAKENIREMINKGNIEQLDICTIAANVSIRKDALQTILNEADGEDIKITILERCHYALTETQKEIVGDRPVYKFTVESGGEKISEFGGSIIISLPYYLQEGENPDGVTVFYIDKNGNIEETETLCDGYSVTFTTNHFSEYFIRNVIEEQKELIEDVINRPKDPEEEPDQTDPEEEPDQAEPEAPEEDSDQTDTEEPIKKKKSKKKQTETKVEELVEEPKVEEEIKLNFIDVKENGWYIDAIKYAVKNNIAAGTTDTTFSPSDPITRGQAITMLCKAYNIEKENEGENFIDAGDTYYTGYILALKNKNLLSGTGNNKVEPKKEITRQELMVMLYKIMEYRDSITENNEEVIDESLYDDANEISNWARKEVDYFIKNKIIVGNNGKINPKGKTTRAETVQIIYNLSKKSK